VCPVTGYPDYARIVLRYVPDKLCVELKSWKIFLSSFYGVGCFHEQITEKVFNKILSALNPKWCHVYIEWGARGGLKTETQMDYWRKDEQGEPIDLSVDIFNWDQFERSAFEWKNS
jgi:7-cyano-7-deazaguanine reductase